MRVLAFFVHDRKCPFWVNLVEIVNIVSLRWNLIPRLIGICKIEWWCSLFCCRLETPFQANLVQNVKIVSLSLNLVARLIRICRIQWCCSPFLIFKQKCCFWTNLVQKIKIINLSWNLLAEISYCANWNHEVGPGSGHGLVVGTASCWSFTGYLGYLDLYILCEIAHSGNSLASVHWTIILWSLDAFLIFPNFLRSYLKSFDILWSYSYIPYLQVIIAHRFSCGERKIW